MRSWKEIWQPKTYLLVQVHVYSSTVELMIIHVRKGKTIGKPLLVSSMEEVVDQFGQYIPLRIHVTGTGVLTRLTDYIQGYKEQLIVNGDKDEFYFTTYHDDSKILVSFFRKNLIENLIQSIEEQKLFLLSITSSIVPFLIISGSNELITFDYNVQLSEGKLLKLERNDIPVERTILSGIFYTYSELLCLSISSLTTKNLDQFQQGMNMETSIHNQEEYIQYNQFRFFGLSIVFLVLISLIGNHFYLNHLNQEIANIEVELTLHNDNLALLNKLQQEQTRKELLIENSGVFQKHFITFYLDKIIGTVPLIISIQEANIFPPKEALKEKRKLELENQTLSIQGTTPTSEILEEWMQKMNRFSWVKSVELMNYLKENKEASFKLLITFQE